MTALVAWAAWPVLLAVAAARLLSEVWLFDQQAAIDEELAAWTT